MKQIDLGQALTILANLGVIAGIVFLGLELSQNQELARAQMRNDLTQETRDISRADINGPIADILVRDRRGDPLSEADQFRLGIWRGMWLNHAENMYAQFQQDLFPRDLLDSQLSTMVRGIPGFWESICRGNRNAEFSSYVRNLVDESCQ